jgi:hypothetical protein
MSYFVFHSFFTHYYNHTVLCGHLISLIFMNGDGDKPHSRKDDDELGRRDQTSAAGDLEYHTRESKVEMRVFKVITHTH